MRYSAIALAAAAVLAADAAQAQAGNMFVSSSFLTPQFFISLLAGVLLAIGFQMLLTSLSVATGISLTPNLKEWSAKRQADKAAAKDAKTHEMTAHHSSAIDPDGDGGMPFSVKVTSTLGLWAMVTTSVALFFASYLAVQLSLVTGVQMGMILGLVIWATFFALMTWFEFRTASTLIGGIINTALAGMRGSVSALRSLAGHSQKEQARLNAEATMRAIRDEVLDMNRKYDFTRKLETYLDEVKPPELDYDRLHDEIADLLQGLTFEEQISLEEDHLNRMITTHLNRRQIHANRHRVRKLASELKAGIDSARANPGSRGDKLIAAADRLTPGTEEDSRRFREQVAAWFRDTGRDELNPDQLRADLERMLDDPQATPEILRARLAQLDRETIVSLVESRSDIPHDQAETLVNLTLNVAQKAAKRLGSTRGQLSGKLASGKEGISSKKESAVETAKDIPARIEERIAAYFDSLERPEFDYHSIKRDIQLMVEEPGMAPEILRERLDEMDRDSLKAIIRSYRRFSDEDAEQIVSHLEEVRDEAKHRLQRMEDQIRSRYENTRRHVIIEAEHLRESAQAASWWAFTTAAVSGLAASAGGYMAMI